MPGPQKKAVYISYNAQRQQEAETVYDRLLQAGLQPWMAAHDLLPGMDWQRATIEAIRKADCFLAILS
jgi:hypothetical protein